jgi:hypothetical protein
LSRHRLHDFVELGKKIFSAIGEEPDRFVKMMDDMRRETGAEIAAGDTFITAMQGLLRKIVKAAPTGASLPGWKAWFPSGYTAIRLDDGGAVVGLRAKYLVANLKAPLTTGADWLPRNERELAGALLRTMPIFSDIGIGVGRREPSKGHTYWEFSLSPGAVADLDGQDA